jgi:hypothetical protein
MSDMAGEAYDTRTLSPLGSPPEALGVPVVSELAETDAAGLALAAAEAAADRLALAGAGGALDGAPLGLPGGA